MSDALTVLAFDFGLKRIGVAVGNTATRTATALNIIRNANNKPDWPQIEAHIKEWQPQRLIVGLPQYDDKAQHPMTAAIERFSRQLAGRFTLPVSTIDERLSSYEADQRAPDGQGDDAMAAQVILETWLNERQADDK